MADLALDLPIFVASPRDVGAERRIAEEEIRNLAAAAAEGALLISPILWETSALPSVGRPQEAINRLLARSELIIVIFSSSLGTTTSPEAEDSGSLEELFRATEQVFRGASDDVFVYFRDGNGDGSPEHERVVAFRKRLAETKRYFFWTYQDETSFRTALSDHLEKWLNRWRRVPTICSATLQESAPGPAHEMNGETRLLFVRENFRYDRESELTARLGQEAIRLYQLEGPDGVEEPIGEAVGAEARDKRLVGSTDLEQMHAIRFAQMLGRLTLYPTPLRCDGRDVYFSDREWFAFFCARGLIDAILADNIAAVEMKPYVNTVHQYLAALGRRDRERIIPALERWLMNQEGVTDLQPIARNFAAYVLGMLDAREAEAALAEAAEFDDGKDVRLYCITALGKIRSRRHLGLLLRLYDRESNAALRTTLGQAICRTIGIARYEL